MSHGKMPLSALIAQLTKIKDEYGDLPVVIQSLTHIWDPDPELRPVGAGIGAGKPRPTHVLLNP